MTAGNPGVCSGANPCDNGYACGMDRRCYKKGGARMTGGNPGVCSGANPAMMVMHVEWTADAIKKVVQE